MGAFSIPDIANAIGTAEGYGIPGAVPTLANNPGDLALGDLGNGTMGNGITIFPTGQAGANALQNQLQLIASGQSSVYSPNDTLAQIGQKYAGGGTGSTNWTTNVASALGVSADSTFSSLLAGVAAGSPAGSPVSAVASAASGAGAVASAASGVSAFTFINARIAAFALGIVSLAGGVLMFDKTSTVIQTVGRAAVKGAEIAG